MESCRLHSKYPSDPAILNAGEAAEVLFLRSLAYCAEEETDGFIPGTQLKRFGLSRAESRAAALVRERLWVPEAGGWRVRKWLDWQHSTAKVRAKRTADRDRLAARRNGQVSHACSALQTVTPANGSYASSALQDEGVARESHASSALQDPPKEPGAPARAQCLQEQIPPHPLKGVTPPRRTATRLPDDFTPSEAALTWADTEKIPHSVVQAETAKFIDYWRAEAGQRARKLDWEATWRNWLRRAGERSPRNGTRPSTTDAAVAQAQAQKLNPRFAGRELPA